MREALSAQAPRSFRNKFPADKPAPPQQIIRNEHLRLKNGRMNYVVTMEGKLIVGRTSQNLPGGGHIDLASGEKVLAAGDVHIVNGKSIYMDNSSEHYLPVGGHARSAAEKAFSDAGFDAAGKYVEKAWDRGRGKWIPVE